MFSGRRPTAHKLGNRFVHRMKPAKVNLFSSSSCSPVVVDHLARRVAGTIGYPGLGFSTRKRPRYERGSQVLHANRDAGVGTLKQIGSVDAGELQVLAEFLGKVTGGNWVGLAISIQKDAAGFLRARSKVLLSGSASTDSLRSWDAVARPGSF